MTFDEIIHSFAESETVPADAIRAALAAPAEFVEKAIPLLERVAATKSTDEEDASLSVLVHVLGEIGDPRAFLPLMRVLALPPDELDILLGDVVTGSLGNVVISLVGDRALVLEEILVDTRIDDFVRDALFDAWTRLVLTGEVPREKAKAFLSDYPVRVGLDSSDFGWPSWVDSVTALGFAEVRDLAREHLAKEDSITSILDTPNVTFEDFERQLAETLFNPERWKGEPKYQPFTGTIEELSGWYGYSEQYRMDRARIDAMADENDALVDEDGSIFDMAYTASNPYRDVGRNDPCPCGSGKKFKKCCLS
jgi:uncharacterized protein